jgi:hypothetical protein
MIQIQLGTSYAEGDPRPLMEVVICTEDRPIIRQGKKVTFKKDWWPDNESRCVQLVELCFFEVLHDQEDPWLRRDSDGTSFSLAQFKAYYEEERIWRESWRVAGLRTFASCFRVLLRMGDRQILTIDFLPDSNDGHVEAIIQAVRDLDTQPELHCLEPVMRLMPCSRLLLPLNTQKEFSL